MGNGVMLYQKGMSPIDKHCHSELIIFDLRQSRIQWIDMFLSYLEYESSIESEKAKGVLLYVNLSKDSLLINSSACIILKYLSWRINNMRQKSAKCMVVPS